MSVAQSGVRDLGRISADRSLWREVRVDAERKSPSDLRRIVRFLHPGTVSFGLVGRKRTRRQTGKSRPLLTTSFLYSLSLRSPGLRSLSLENVLLGRQVLQSLPTCVESLSLVGCVLDGLPRVRALVTSPLLVLKKRQHRLTTVQAEEGGNFFD